MKNILGRRSLFLFGVLLLVLLSFAVYQSLQFKVTEITPSGKLATSMSAIEIKFNKPLGENDASQIIVAPDSTYVVNFYEQSVVIRLTQKPSKGTVNLSLKGIKSIDGKLLTKTYTYEIAYVAYSDLPKSEQQRQITDSNSFERDYPLIKGLPILTEDYSIDYRFPDGDEKRLPIIITMEFGIDPDVNGRTTDKSRQEYITRIRSSRLEAIEYLKSQGYTPDKYRLVFGEPEIVSEFDGTYEKP